MKKNIPIEISARHIHLSQQDVDQLFGEGTLLQSALKISQPHQFVAEQRVDLVGPKKTISKVAIVGPVRSDTQVEISRTDAITLGIPDTPIAVSGSHNETVGGLTLRGTVGEIELKKGVMIAARHVHASPDQARSFGLKHGDCVDVHIISDRPLTFHNVIIRSREDVDDLALHLDTDEANAAGVTMHDTAEIL